MLEPFRTSPTISAPPFRPFDLDFKSILPQSASRTSGSVEITPTLPALCGKTRALAALLQGESKIAPMRRYFHASKSSDKRRDPVGSSGAHPVSTALRPTAPPLKCFSVFPRFCGNAPMRTISKRFISKLQQALPITKRAAHGLRCVSPNHDVPIVTADVIATIKHCAKATCRNCARAKKADVSISTVRQPSARRRATLSGVSR